MTPAIARFLKAPVAIIAGTMLLWCLTLTLQAMAGRGPDRSVAIQAPLALLVLGAPLLSARLGAGRERLRWPLLAAQIGCYVLYETGISIDTNIRIDVFLIYPAILLNAWLLFRTAPPPGVPAVRPPASARLAGALGILVALLGGLGSVALLVSPPLVANYSAWVAEAHTGPEWIFPTPEARQQAHDRLRVPPWFRPYCFGLGTAGLAVSGFLLWGTGRLRRSAPRGPEIFALGAALDMLVAACIAAAGLGSSSPMVRLHFAPAIILLMLAGILLLLVRKAALRRPAPGAG